MFGEINLADSVFGAALGAMLGFALNWDINRRKENKALALQQEPIRNLLRFNDEPIFFIYPPRHYYQRLGGKNEEVKSFLPGTSTEDFLAINNMITVLLNMGRRDYKIRTWDWIQVDPNHEEYIGKYNIILICSPKSNRVSRTFQSKIDKIYDEPYVFEEYKHLKGIDENGEEETEQRVRITRGSGEYYSESFKQHERFESAIDPKVPDRKYTDIGIITQTDNPWFRNSNGKGCTKALMVAGIRGIGTWGAAECLKKERPFAKLIQEYESVGCPENYSARVEVDFRNGDIEDHRIVAVKALKLKP